MNRPCRDFHDRYHECLDRRIRPQADPLLVDHAASCPECAEWLKLDSIWDEPWQAVRPESLRNQPRAGLSRELEAPNSPAADSPAANPPATNPPAGRGGRPDLAAQPSLSVSSPSLPSSSLPSSGLPSSGLARGARLGAAVRWWATVAAGVVVCWLAQPRTEGLNGPRWAFSPERSGADAVASERELAMRSAVPAVGIGDNFGDGIGDVGAANSAGPKRAEFIQPLTAVAGLAEENRATAELRVAMAVSGHPASLGLVGSEVGLGDLAYDWLAPDTLSYAASSPALQRWKGEILATAPQFGGAALRPDLPWRLVRQRLEPQMVASQRFVDPVMQQLRPWSRTMNRAWNVWRRSLSGKSLDSPATES